MALCSICERNASYLLNGRWYCENCMQTVLDKPAPCSPPMRKNVLILDEKKKVIRAPFCSICQDRVATFVIFGTAICWDCSKSKREWPEDVENDIDGPAKPKRPGLGASVIDFPDEYICVDVETTGRDPAEDEIIEIGALRVKNGAVCDTFTSLVKPLWSHVPWTLEEIQTLGYQSFSDVPRAVFEDNSNRRILPDEIVNLTGINDDMLRDAPTASEVIPQFYAFVGDRALVGHNVIFDLYFLYDACQQCALLLGNDHIDTLRISRNLLPELPGHKLSNLVKHFGIEQKTAHRAEADARATVACFEAMKELVLQKQTIPDYVKGFVDPIRRPSTRARKKIYAEKKLCTADLVAPDTVDPDHPLCRKQIVFTGELSMARVDAAQMAADAGAIVKTSVSRKTDFLVVGQQDINLVGSSGISTKEKKAKEINAAGKGNIQILSEEDFVQLAGPKTKEGTL